MACPLENVKSITSLLVDFDVIFMVPRQLNVSANTMMGNTRSQGKIYDLSQPCVTRTVLRREITKFHYFNEFRLSISLRASDTRRWSFFRSSSSSISEFRETFQTFFFSDMDDCFYQSALVHWQIIRASCEQLWREITKFHRFNKFCFTISALDGRFYSISNFAKLVPNSRNVQLIATSLRVTSR